MIRTSKQLKDKVKNISNSDAKIAQAYIRTFIMERFLERVSISEYHDQFILKGGMFYAKAISETWLWVRVVNIWITNRKLRVNIIE